MDLSVILPVLVTGAGIYLFFELRGFFVTSPGRVIKTLAGTLGDSAGFRSFSLALAGTLGVGNIFGVAAGILMGGAGSVLWLFVSSLFAMIIKYAETTLAADKASEGRGGMHLTLLSTFRRSGRALSVIYAVLCLILAFSMGFCMQSASVLTVAKLTLRIPSGIGAAVLVMLLLPSVLGGGKRIEKFTTFAIPLTTIIYIIMTLAIILINISSLPSVVSEILRSAFSPLSFGGGLMAFLSSRALREGYCRGILSNEAGAGTSAMAHTRATEREPAVAGLYGMCEVFFDTTLLCTLTALAILTSVPDPSAFSSPMSLVTEAFVGTLGVSAGGILLVCIFLFAYSTIVCWFYYGNECATYLFGGSSAAPFLLFFTLFVALGALGESPAVLSVTDTVILLMSVITLLTLVKCSDRIRELTVRAGLLD